MNYKVLVVDDALFMRTMIKDILKNSGKYDVVGEAVNGDDAIQKFKSLLPDLVTMDIVMPGMDGIEATREILKFDPKARIVMCSALGQEPLVIESIAAGAKDFIVKPFTPEKVIEVMDHVARGPVRKE
ncbi:MAG TPA: response regulator [Acidobacteriota bacterium]|nr:response regulator [Acidobacteriota bacterium]